MELIGFILIYLGWMMAVWAFLTRKPNGAWDRWWWGFLCKRGWHGVRRVEQGHECKHCYRLRWKRGYYPGPRR